MPLNTCCSWDVLLCTTLYHFGVRAAALVTLLEPCGGKYKVLLLDAIRTGLQVNQILLPHGWNTGALPWCRIVPWAEVWPLTTALHRSWLRWAAEVASADTLKLFMTLKSFPRLELKTCQQVSYMSQYSIKIWNNVAGICFDILESDSANFVFFRKDISVLIFQSWYCI